MVPNPECHHRLPKEEVRGHLHGVGRRKEACGVYPQADQGVARDEFDDDSWSNNDERINNDDRGHHNDRGDDAAAAVELLVGGQDTRTTTTTRATTERTR
jgi:hypothetical protein